jgi:triosephosphate isomerase (TIM)
MIFVNFKAYEQGTGKNALTLVKILEEAADSAQVKIIPVVQAADIREAVAATKLEVWTQHVDAVEFGAHTGMILPEAVLEDGAVGTFLNHSERKFPDLATLKEAVGKAQSLGLRTLVFASNLEELSAVAAFAPTYVAYEPPEFIGSTTTSVTSAQPEIILKAVEIAKSQNLPLIVGAGIHSREDVRKSLELGAAGVAVATDIVKSPDPRKEVLELAGGLQ